MRAFLASIHWWGWILIYLAIGIPAFCYAAWENGRHYMMAHKSDKPAQGCQDACCTGPISMAFFCLCAWPLVVICCTLEWFYKLWERGGANSLAEPENSHPVKKKIDIEA